MSVLDREKFFEAVEGRIGEDTSDDAIQFLEDMTDTYNDMETRAAGDGVDWKSRYEELDEKWKKKYTRRFFAGGTARTVYREEDEEEAVEDGTTPGDKITYADLFKED